MTSTPMIDAMRPWIAAALALAAVPACGNDEAAEPGPDAAPLPPEVDAAPAPQPGLRVLDYVIAVDVTPDGTRAVFEDLTGEVTAVVIDTATGQILDEVAVGDPSLDLATGIANTGAFTALHGAPVQAGVWSAGAWVDLASPFSTGCDPQVGASWDLSADGHVVVGFMWNNCAPQAFRWSDAGGTGVLTPLELLGSHTGTGPATNRATVVSDDGTTAAGFAELGNVDRTPALWRADGSGELLDLAVTDTPGEVLSINADGTVAAGNIGWDGFVWTRGTGLAMLRRFDVALPTDPVYPNAMTAAGDVVFGGVGDAFFGVPIAFAWTARDGMKVLADVATAAGITIPTGMILHTVLGASADGTVLIGTASDVDFNLKTFVLRLPAGAIAP